MDVLRGALDGVPRIVDVQVGSGISCRTYLVGVDFLHLHVGNGDYTAAWQQHSVGAHADKHRRASHHSSGSPPPHISRNRISFRAQVLYTAASAEVHSEWGYIYPSRYGSAEAPLNTMTH